MKPKTIIVLAALVLFGGTSYVHACGNTPVLSTTTQDGTVIGLYISDEQLARTPKWQPQKGEPPISPSQVWKVVSKWGKEKLTRFDGIRIRSINLSRSACGGSGGRWYYIIHYDPIIDGSALYSSGSFAAVLMDGTVIGPEKGGERSRRPRPSDRFPFFGRRDGRKL